MGKWKGADCSGEDHDIDFDRLPERFGLWSKDLWDHGRKHGRI